MSLISKVTKYPLYVNMNRFTLPLYSVWWFLGGSWGRRPREWCSDQHHSITVRLEQTEISGSQCGDELVIWHMGGVSSQHQRLWLYSCTRKREKAEQVPFDCDVTLRRCPDTIGALCRLQRSKLHLIVLLERKWDHHHQRKLFSVCLRHCPKDEETDFRVFPSLETKSQWDSVWVWSL